MAEKIENYDFKGKASRIRIDWELVLNGDTWKLVRGVDFKCQPSSVRARAFAICKNRGLQIRTTIELDTIFLQAYKKEQP